MADKNKNKTLYKVPHRSIALRCAATRMGSMLKVLQLYNIRLKGYKTSIFY